MIKLYGIKNCDTVKKAIKQLAAQNVSYEFMDLKTVTLSEDLLKDWLAQSDALVNKRSTTYRQIKTDWLAAENNVGQQIQLLQANPTLIKRPVLVKSNGEIIVGFSVQSYQALA